MKAERKRVRKALSIEDGLAGSAGVVIDREIPGTPY
jgi:hypothetical protein